MFKLKYSSLGFTLAELLIALAILGMIASFTIPKILINQQNQQCNAATKEAVGMISGAFQIYAAQNQPTSVMTVSDLTPYFNYIKLDTSRTIDNKYGSTNLSCNVAGGGCLIMHNGGALRYNGSVLGGTNTTNAFEFIYDPDGIETDGTTNGPGKAVDLFLYSNGLIRTRGTTLVNTMAGGTTYASPAPSADPPWFSW